MMRRSACLVALACSLSGLQVGSANASVGDPLPPDTVLTVRGKGWGHGRGMGQWGSKGMADEGSKHRQILKHYYAGIAFADRGNPVIRVLVQAAGSTVVTSTQPFKVKAQGGEVIADAPAKSFWRITYSGGQYIYARSDTNSGYSLVTKDSRYAIFAAPTGMLELVRPSGTVRRYRGTITARYTSGDGMRAINNLPVEGYLRGVVPRESPSSWPAEQLRSQSIAARTYAYRHRDTSRSRGNMFDICSTTSCQVYEGHSGRSQPGGTITQHEATSTNNAISATAGQIMSYSDAPILAEYSSSTGGYTAPGSVPYQQAVPDPGDQVSPHHSWSASIPVTTVESKWPGIGRLVRIDVTERNGYGEWGGRVRKVDIVGTKKTVQISGDQFRGAFAWPSGGDVRSSWFTIGIVKAKRASVPTSTAILQGTQKTLLYRYRNVGTDPWFVGGDLQLKTNSGSPLQHASWISPTVITKISRNVTRPKANLVQPNEVAEFRVTLDATGMQPGSVNVPIRLVPGAGTHIDASTLRVTITSSWIERAPNLLTSSSFEKGWREWTRTLRKGDKFGDGRDRSRGVVMSGQGTRRIEQRVTFAGGMTRRFTLGAWASLRKATLKAVAILDYANGTTRRFRLSGWNTDGTWRYAERGFRSLGDRHLRSVTVRFNIDISSGGAVRLDAIRFFEEPVGNPSFEAKSLAPWKILQQPAGELPPRRAGWTAWDGGSSLLLRGRPEPSTVEQRFGFAARAFDRLTLRFAERVITPNSDADPLTVTLTLEHHDGSETTSTLEIARAPHPWRPASIEVRPTAAVTHARITIHQQGQTGKIYLDQFRLLRSRLSDPSFESVGTWAAGGLAAGSGLKATAARDGALGVRLAGSERSVIAQEIPLKGPRSRVLRVGFFDVVSGPITRTSRVQVIVTFFHTNGTRVARRIELADQPHPWRWTEVLVGANKRFERVRVAVRLDGHPGTAFVDQLLVVDR